jgi:predicted transcriptional regulator
MARYVTKEFALSNPLRARLLEVVGTQPGITMGELAGRLGCRPSTILWHMTKLEKADLLRSARVGNVRVFYLPSGGAALRERSLAKAVLKNDVARRIHEVVQQRPGITFRDLRLLLAGRASSLRWHARRLVDEGLLRFGDDRGRATSFYPVAGPSPPAPDGSQAA